jgi:hypothetical protein
VNDCAELVLSHSMFSGFRNRNQFALPLPAGSPVATIPASERL